MMIMTLSIRMLSALNLGPVAQQSRHILGVVRSITNLDHYLTYIVRLDEDSCSPVLGLLLGLGS